MSEQVNPALDRITDACKRTSEAMKAEGAARAEYARLELLKIGDAHPGVEGFSFEVEYVYDDEGGYFPSVNIYTTWAADSEQYEFYDQTEDEIIDISQMINEDALSWLGEGKTIDELREVRF